MKKLLILLAFTVLLSACVPNQNTPNTPVVSSESKTIATPTYGSGKHVVEIFADFQCPACISFAKNIGPIFEWYAEKWQLKIIYRQFPLTQIHKNAYRDALAALCAADQGKYMDYKKALYAFEETKAWATVTDNDRVNTAKGAGLDGVALQSCLEAEVFKSQVDADMTYGESLKILWTPTVILDGRTLDFGVFQDVDMLVKFLDRVVNE